MADERNSPRDVFVHQAGEEFSNALSKTWGNGQHWRSITNVADMISEIESACGERGYLRLLRIGGHGSPGSFRIGNKIISVQSIEDYAVLFADMHPYVKSGKTVIQLDHCCVAHDNVLLKRFAVLTGNTVVIASYDQQETNDGAPQFEGKKVNVCSGRACIVSYTPNDSISNHISYIRYWEAISGASVLQPQGPVD